MNDIEKARQKRDQKRLQDVKVYAQSLRLHLNRVQRLAGTNDSQLKFPDEWEYLCALNISEIVSFIEDLPEGEDGTGIP